MFNQHSTTYSPKTLNQADVSGEILTANLFPEKYHPYFLDFEKIQYDHRKNSWIFIDHILLDIPVSSYDDVPEHIKYKIETLFSFASMMTAQSGKHVDVLVSFYFPKQSYYTDGIQRLRPDDFQIFNVSTSHYSHIFKTINHRSSNSQFNRNFDIVSNEDIWNARIDDSAFALSKACLGKEYTNGFNIDKILYFQEINKCALFEYLLCDSSQKVTPYTSHPNNYHKKNSFKFNSLWKFSQDINSSIYMLNYAKDGQHVDKIKFMKFVDYQPQNKETPVITENKNTTIKGLRASIEQRFAPSIVRPSF